MSFFVASRTAHICGSHSGHPYSIMQFASGDSATLTGPEGKDRVSMMCCLASFDSDANNCIFSSLKASPSNKNSPPMLTEGGYRSLISFMRPSARDALMTFPFTSSGLKLLQKIDCPLGAISKCVVTVQSSPGKARQKLIAPNCELDSLKTLISTEAYKNLLRMSLLPFTACRARFSFRDASASRLSTTRLPFTTVSPRFAVPLTRSSPAFRTSPFSAKVKFSMGSFATQSTLNP
mmetsp:Transcript_26759/g.31562  ORF Transcript_26759/g.31562 Transcript_26759/m.31562 type:complete len:235 (-) Transcript_26759:1446-2150(-)